MDNSTFLVYKYSELMGLRKLRQELEKNLHRSDKVDLGPLIKLQKSLNNALMKTIAQTEAPVAQMAKLKLKFV